MANVGLYRSNRSNMIAGVMGGIAERFGWNVTLLRVIFVIISCMSAAFPGILVYLILWLVMPKQNPAQMNMAGYKNPVRTVNDDPLS
ncbi:PspC domain-containing protein [Acinetobacter sp. ANC 3813]|uniref:PspC domain-containing protein n=1 Tax=Acinetobacter sp. ANC 3813 TaxID=1977873 RepID=UPI000A358095|nr:PspC domain-containing protein [Acinetobacter sp. ANC 3813]OTG90113.1 PspC family transcriptional regulator [Acinetobacter sp. ANC 3813]